MQRASSDPRHARRAQVLVAAAAGAALTLPFAALEWRLGGGFPQGVPLALYAALWVLASAVLGLAAVLLRRLQHGGRRPGSWDLAAIAAIVLLAVLWATLVRDQLPCFLGVPNCD